MNVLFLIYHHISFDLLRYRIVFFSKRGNVGYHLNVSHLTGREGKRFPHLLHVPVAIRGGKCFQCQHVGHPSLPGFRQGLRYNICSITVGY